MFDQAQLFAAALQITEPLYVETLDFKPIEGELHIHLNFRKGSKFKCPDCGEEHLNVHDTLEKTWRHLNFFQYKAYIHYRTPRVNCPKHGVRLVNVPWADPKTGFTMLFEALVMQFATAMAVNRIAQMVDEHDTRIWRIINRHVDRARSKADYSEVEAIGIDETSSKKHHKYVTLFVDMPETRVIHVCEGKDSDTLQSFKTMLNDGNINPGNLTTNQAEKLKSLSKLNLKTGRAYRIKLALQDVYANATDKNRAMQLLNNWYKWASRSKLKPITEFAKTVKKNWSGILNYFDSKLTNGILESVNSIVQAARNRARGYRNINIFITMIFLLGGKLKLEI